MGSQRTRSGRAPGRVARLALFAIGIVAGGSASAGLGEARDSVARDHAAFGGRTLSVTTAPTYDLIESVVPGGYVREFVGRDGTVFGVAWSGRSLPDLKRLLAAHYPDFLSAARAGHLSRAVRIATPELELSVQRLPRGFVGRAWLPASLPPGTAPDELR